ncbi:MAG TPA: very short patch repair endonuclease [Roseomonas sp.]
MARIPVRDTKPELALRAVLGRIGATPHRIDVGGLPGRPDVVLRDPRAALFAHGCFWHHHEGCRCGRLPNTTYRWADKFNRTRARDEAARDALIDAGWRVVWVWECALVGANALPKGMLDEAIASFLRDDARFLEIEGRGVAKPAALAPAA